MRTTDPPRSAAWVLEHLTLGTNNDALAGDLAECVRSGRSKGWYWRQVVGAVAVGCARTIRGHGTLLAFAGLWAMFSPAWLIFVFAIESRASFYGPMWQLDWPWSTLCALGLSFALNLMFLWAGMLLYMVPTMSLSRSFDIGGCLRSFVRSVPVFLAAPACVFALMTLLSFPGDVTDVHHFTVWNEITNVNTWAVAARVPYFLTLVCALWRWTPQAHNGSKRIAG